jgi:hypothetical protein
MPVTRADTLMLLEMAASAVTLAVCPVAIAALAVTWAAVPVAMAASAEAWATAAEASPETAWALAFATCCDVAIPLTDKKFVSTSRPVFVKTEIDRVTVPVGTAMAALAVSNRMNNAFIMPPS